MAGIESDDVSESIDFSDDISSITGSYDEVGDDDYLNTNRRMEHLMDVIRNSPYINVSFPLSLFVARQIDKDVGISSQNF